MPDRWSAPLAGGNPSRIVVFALRYDGTFELREEIQKMQPGWYRRDYVELNKGELRSLRRVLEALNLDD